ncbi:hypothetical protein GGQ84_002850 [Desulfitispora alkaliphila]|uniref:helix-turn-helix domain-containing protein n=1 Tax=Desulfitispora alkaliphila TaxID=622674 RepID=UPI003D24FC7D
MKNEKNKDKNYEIGEALVPESMGSATYVNLDGQSEPDYSQFEMPMISGDIRTAPWGLQPSLESMCREAGVDFDGLIQGYLKDESDQELANRYGVKESTIACLKKHFEQYGIDSVVGND